MWSALGIQQRASETPLTDGSVAGLRAALARHWGVATQCLVVGGDLTTALLSVLVPSGTHVVVAEPTDPDLLAAIIAHGVRYVDAGRDYRFRVHPQGWRFATRSPNAGLALLSRPNEPTQTWPAAARMAEAPIPVLSDERYRDSPLAPLDADLVWRSFILWCGQSVEVFVGPPDIAAAVGRVSSTPGDCDSVLAAMNEPEPFERSVCERAASLEANAQEAVALGLEVVAVGPRALWMRVPGQISCEAALAISLNDGESRAAIGSPHWTWRDGVRVVPNPALLERIKQCMT